MVKGKLIALMTAAVVGTGILTAAVLNEGNVNKLKGEVEKTRTTIENYENAENEMKEKYTSLKTQAEGEIVKANGLIEEKNKRIETLSGEVIVLNANVNQLKNEVAELKEDLKTANKNIKELKKTIEEKEAEIKKLEGEIKEKEELINTLYEEIRILKEKIELLDKEIIDLNKQLESEKTEIKRLEGELEKANAEIDEANKVILEEANKLEEILKSNKPMTEDELSEYTGALDKSIEDKNEIMIKDFNVSFAGACSLDFTLNEDVDIALKNKGNVIISYYGEDGNLIKRKDKTWSGYLVGANGDRYGQEILQPNKYKTGLKKDEVYATTLIGDEFSNKVAKVVLTIVDNEGNKTSLERVK